MTKLDKFKHKQQTKIDKTTYIPIMGKWCRMRIIARAMLRNFWQQPKYNEAEQALRAWFDEVKHEDWKSPQDIKQKYRHASFVANNRVVFNIHGNKYRLIVAIRYDLKIVFIRFIGTHVQYDQIDASII